MTTLNTKKTYQTEYNKTHYKYKKHKHETQGTTNINNQRKKSRKQIKIILNKNNIRKQKKYFYKTN